MLSGVLLYMLYSVIYAMSSVQSIYIIRVCQKVRAWLFCCFMPMAYAVLEQSMNQGVRGRQSTCPEPMVGCIGIGPRYGLLCFVPSKSHHSMLSW